MLVADYGPWSDLSPGRTPSRTSRMPSAATRRL